MDYFARMNFPTMAANPCRTCIPAKTLYHAQPFDTLFQLIHSMQKAEKRAFKLYAKRHGSNEDLKMIQLFDVMDKMPEYDDTVLLRKLDFTKKSSWLIARFTSINKYWPACACWKATITLTSSFTSNWTMPAFCTTKDCICKA